MSDDLQSPNLVEKGKNLSKVLVGINKLYSKKLREKLYLMTKIYKERLSICKTCDKYKESRMSVQNVDAISQKQEW